MKRNYQSYLLLIFFILFNSTHALNSFVHTLNVAYSSLTACNLLLTATGLAGIYVTSSCILAKKHEQKDAAKKQKYWPATAGGVTTIASLLILIFKQNLIEYFGILADQH